MGVDGPEGPSTRRRIRIRMYRVGFGDCFLVSLFGGEGGSHHLLFDCGVHPAGDLRKLPLVIDNIAEETGRQLALIVASHAHEDHIAGFGRHGDLFERFTIGQVWLPWSEKPGDELAIRLRRRQAATFAMLDDHFRASPPSAAAAAALENVGFGRNQRSLDNLRRGFGTTAKIEFVKADPTFSADLGVPGLTLRVLGPSQKEDDLKRMNPPKAERFLRLGPDGQVEAANVLHPFSGAELGREEYGGLPLTDDGEKQLRDRATGSLESLAFVLDQALNNTSVVVLVSYFGHNLLFPGDAQFGAWKQWMEQPDGEEILADLDFYKVSHHGSENATPKSALGHMRSAGVAAMVSTQGTPWPSIPDTKLMDALAARTGNRIVRSDSLPLDGVPTVAGIADLPEGIAAGDLWYDLTIPV
jgi:hypothetical protein